jgi:hypothetical protein
MGPTQALIKLTLGALSPGVTRQGRETDSLPPPSAELKNIGAIRPLPHMP